MIYYKIIIYSKEQHQGNEIIKEKKKGTIISYEPEKTNGKQNSSNQISQQLEVATKQQDLMK